MGFDFPKDVFAIGADLGISWGVSRLGALGKGVPTQVVADIGGGALGGGVATAISDGWSMSNFGQGVFLGGVGGALGSGLSFGLGKGLQVAKRNADEAVTNARNAHNVAEEDASKLSDIDTVMDGIEDAQKALDDAKTRFLDARTTLEQKEDILDSLTPGSRAWAQAKQEVDTAENALTAAGRDLTAKHGEYDDALRKLDGLDETDLDEAVAKTGEELLALQKKAEWFADGSFLSKYSDGLHAWTVALSSMVPAALNYLEFGEGSSNGSAGAGSVDLVWDGYQPAAAASLYGTAPFGEAPVPGANVIGGQGFLLRPSELSAEVIRAYGAATGSFASSVVDIYQISGDLEKKIHLRIDPAPQMPQGITVGESGGGISYEQARNNIDSSLDELYKSELDASAITETVGKISTDIKDKIGYVIATANTRVTQLAATTEIEIVFMENVVSQGFTELIGILEDAAKQMDRVALGIEDPSIGDDAASRGLNDRVGAFDNSMNNPALWPDGSKIGGVPDPSGLNGLGVGTPNIPGTASADLADAAKQIQDRASDALQASTPDVPAPPSGSLGGITPPNPMGAAGGMGSGLMNSLLPMLMSQAAMRNGADSDLARRVDDIDPSRYDVAAAPTMPAARPPSTTPWSNPAPTTPAPAQPVQHQSAPPPGATSNQTSTGMPKRVPGPDGLVAYPFPDGRTQKVPLTVALGLDKAFANKAGTDAQAAYAGTPAAWTDPKDIGPAVDPFRLATGDVATWLASAKDEGRVPAGASAVVATPAGGLTEGENEPPEGEKKTGDQPSGSGGDPEYSSALLVVFGEGESGTVEAVVNGELQQYAPDMTAPDGAAFGEFAGFKHPKGIEAAGDIGQDGDAAATSTDQSATDVPMLAAPA